MSFPANEPVGRGYALFRRARGFFTAGDSDAVARRAGATALVIRLASAGLAYVAQVVFARLMGQYEYGVFAYTWVWFLVFSAVATLGFGDSPVRYIAQLRERSETAHLRGFLRFAALVIVVASVAFAAILVAVLPQADGVIDHAYSTYARGLDGLWGAYQWLDRAPMGRNETGVWWKRHDEYVKA